MSLTTSPTTPRRFLSIRSESERRASTADSYRIKSPSSNRTVNLKSPASSYGESLGSPNVPATPDNLHNLHPATTKHWHGSKLESILEADVHGLPSDFHKYIRATATPQKQQSIDALRIVAHNANLRTSRVGDDIKPGLASTPKSSEDPFAITGTILPLVPPSKNTMNPSNRVLKPHASLLAEGNFSGCRVVSNDNAQELLPPAACVFVANLPINVSNNRIQTMVLQVFGRYGRCWVKIRRQKKDHTPHAFVQYRSPVEARDALHGGKIDWIGGRVCRTEMVIAPRTLQVFRNDGTWFSIELVRRSMSEFGAIAKIYDCPAVGPTWISWFAGYYVEMVYYQSALNANMAFRDHLEWTVDLTRQFQPHVGPGPPTTPPAYNALASMYGVTECLWVSKIPYEVTSEFVASIFSQHGTIKRMVFHAVPAFEIHYGPGVSYALGETVQADIYFADVGSVQRAIQSQTRDFITPFRWNVQPARGIAFTNMRGQVCVRSTPNTVHGE